MQFNIIEPKQKIRIKNKKLKCANKDLISINYYNCQNMSHYASNYHKSSKNQFQSQKSLHEQLCLIKRLIYLLLLRIVFCSCLSLIFFSLNILCASIICSAPEKNQDKIQVLLSFGNKVNAITSIYAASLGLKISLIDVKA